MRSKLGKTIAALHRHFSVYLLFQQPDPTVPWHQGIPMCPSRSSRKKEKAVAAPWAPRSDHSSAARPIHHHSLPSPMFTLSIWSPFMQEEIKQLPREQENGDLRGLSGQQTPLPSITKTRITLTLSWGCWDFGGCSAGQQWLSAQLWYPANGWACKNLCFLFPCAFCELNIDLSVMQHCSP